MAEYKKVKYYYDEELATMLSEKILAEYSAFDQKSFVSAASSRVDDLEYKDRVRVFAEELRQHLPAPYAEALTILHSILGPENPNETGMFSEGYWLTPIAYFVEIYGLDHYQLSIRAIAEVTKRNTGEYAIRPYLERYPDKCLNQMLRWSNSKSFHLRRLSCEGVRPRLPWATKLTGYVENPAPILPILENLKTDSVKYVQKSVANCINDILKDNRDVAMKLLKLWVRQRPADETRWIVKHSLRRLKKHQDPEAMEILDMIAR